MKTNWNTKIVGSKLYLVPYEIHHVPKYHEWMTRTELLQLTASEPLTLEEEYEMQKCWREDADKCTFIILMKSMYDETKNEIDAMVGDTNIFIKDNNDKVGEIEIMIAEKFARGQKLGWEAVILMLLYGIQHIGIQRYEAKISLTNVISIEMFKKLKFEEDSISEVFQEITLQRQVTDTWKTWLQEQYKYEVKSYT